MTLKNAMIATAVASMFAAGAATAGKSAGKKTASVKCVESNECKGHGSCGGADNSCKGQNSCKGHQSDVKDAAACEARGGKLASAEKAVDKKM